tara:strand:- start:1683 stop:1985 length:303 start_codon:yes stop_codon:yes gene_type:complete
MTQNYGKRDNSLSLKSKKEFISSGRSDSIKKRIVRFLSENCPNSYTSRELLYFLDILIASSICLPLNELKKEESIQVSGSKYDDLTNREVSAYASSNCNE